MKIAPSVLSFDFTNFSKQISILNDNVEYLHFDVMDGHFVPNISFGPYILSNFKKVSNLFMDVHLMISNPNLYIKDFVNAGADSITFHFEALNNDINKCIALIENIHSYGIKAGISIKPQTDPKYLDPLLDRVDLILVMSVEPGFGGQKFLDSSLLKVDYLDKYRINNNLQYLIEVDGGINYLTYSKCREANVDIAVIGSYIFDGDIVENIKSLY